MNIAEHSPTSSARSTRRLDAYVSGNGKFLLTVRRAAMFRNMGKYNMEGRKRKGSGKRAAKRIANLRFALALSRNVERGRTDEKGGWIYHKKTGR